MAAIVFPAARPRASDPYLDLSGHVRNGRQWLSWGRSQ